MFHISPLLTVLAKSVPWLHMGSHGMGVLFNSFAVQAKMLFSLFGIKKTKQKKGLAKWIFFCERSTNNASNKVPEARSM